VEPGSADGDCADPVNEYFLHHPETVLEELGAADGTYRADDLTIATPRDTIAA
jgi:hypothetical protein